MTQLQTNKTSPSSTGHLLLWVKKISVLTTVMGTIALSSNMLYAADGGRCTPDDDRQIALVTKLLPAEKSQDSQVEIITAETKTLTLPAWKLNHPTYKGQYLEIDIRRDLLGVCNPFSVLRGEPLQKKGVNLNPTDPQLYQGMFSLEINRNCTQHSNKHCDGEPLLSTHLTQADAKKLTQVEPRTIGSCSPASLQAAWSMIPADSESRVIACVKNKDESEFVVEFLLTKDGENERLELYRLY